MENLTEKRKPKPHRSSDGRGGGSLTYVFEHTRWFVSIPTVICTVFAVALRADRGAHAQLFLLGALLNAIVGKLAKYALAQPRPPPPVSTTTPAAPTSCAQTVGQQSHSQNGSRPVLLMTVLHPERLGHPTDGGMPSTHSQSLFFFVVYLSLELLAPTSGWLATVLIASPSSASFEGHEHHAAVFDNNMYWRLVLCIAMTMFASGSSAYRVRRGYHTWAQIAVGLLMGVVDAVVWQLLVHVTLLPALQRHPSSVLWLWLLCVALAVILLVFRSWMKVRGRQRQHAKQLQQGTGATAVAPHEKAA